MGMLSDPRFPFAMFPTSELEEFTLPTRPVTPFRNVTAPAFEKGALSQKGLRKRKFPLGSGVTTKPTLSKVVDPTSEFAPETVPTVPFDPSPSVTAPACVAGPFAHRKPYAETHYLKSIDYIDFL